MTKELKIYFSKLQKEDNYNNFLFRKIYSKPNTILNYSYIDDVESQDILDPYKNNNKFLEFLNIALNDSEFTNKLDYYILKTLYIFMYENEMLDNDDYNKSLSILLRNRIKFNLNMKTLTGSVKNNNREEIIAKIKNDKYNEPINCVLYNFDISFIKIINSIVCDNEFLDIIDEKFLNQEVNIKIAKNVLDVLKLSINIYTDYFSGNTINDFYTNIITKQKIERYNIDRAINYLKKLNNKINSNEIAKLTLNK